MAVPESAKEDVKIILNGFYDHDFADRINIKKKVVEVVSEMILSAESCSRSIDLVPRPAGVKPALAWVFRQLANKARRVVNNDGVYIMCKNEVARQYRRHIEQASMGSRDYPIYPSWWQNRLLLTSRLLRHLPRRLLVGLL